MPKIHFVDAGGTEYLVYAAIGRSLMAAAVDNDIPGIDAECGGEMSCGTCHVYVRDEWQAKLAPQQPDEAEAIEALVVSEVRTNSRLSCQIGITEELDGLSVDVPAP